MLAWGKFWERFFALSETDLQLLNQYLAADWRTDRFYPPRGPMVHWSRWSSPRIGRIVTVKR
jgi:hypothetical protein